MTDATAVPDPFPLRSIPVPPEVTRVRGCDCGGLEWHREDCSIFAVPVDERMAAVSDARDRLTQHTAALNARLAIRLRELGITA